MAKLSNSAALAKLDEDGDLTKALQSAFPPQKIVAALRKLLRAKVSKYSAKGTLLEEIPDWKAIAAAVQFILHYTEGTPIKRTLRVSVNTGPQMPLPERLAASPQLRRAVLDAAEIAAETAPGGNQGVPGLPVDVEAIKVPATAPDSLTAAEPMTAADYAKSRVEKACQSNPPQMTGIESLVSLLDQLDEEDEKNAT